jgi:hypothetical protein
VSARAFNPFKGVRISFSLQGWQVVPVGYVAGLPVWDVTVDLRDPAQRDEPALLLMVSLFVFPSETSTNARTWS